jgi:hypothetical protein
VKTKFLGKGKRRGFHARDTTLSRYTSAVKITYTPHKLIKFSIEIKPSDWTWTTGSTYEESPTTLPTGKHQNLTSTCLFSDPLKHHHKFQSLTIPDQSLYHQVSKLIYLILEKNGLLQFIRSQNVTPVFPNTLLLQSALRAFGNT